jgi:Undecaprenyl-phosphate galactose phosphotransferase WbaP
MSIAMKRPARHVPPTEANQFKQQHAATLHRYKQILCVLILVLTDVTAIAVCLKLAIFLREFLVPHLDRGMPLVNLSFRHYLDLGWLWLVLVVFLGVEGLYTRRRSLWNEIGQLIKAISLGLVAVLATVALTQLSPEVSRPAIVLMGISLLIVLPIVRFWTKKILGRVGLWRKRILILGVSDTAKMAMRALTSDPVLGYDVVGMIGDDARQIGECAGVYGGKSIFVLGRLSEIWELMKETQTRDILIAMPDLPEEKLLVLVHQLQPDCDSIYVVPKLWGLPMMNLHVDGFLRERVMMLKLSNNLAKPWNIWLKRGFDLVVGTVVMLFATPVGLLLSALIKMGSAGPALFVQERLGYRGGNFQCLKFRTMHANGEAKLVRYLELHPRAADEWHKYAKLRTYDPRVTLLGRYLRRWSLDEFPQLLNVLKGEMSLVGPRPYLPEERGRIGVDLPTILAARPGMTGLWQVSGRNQMTLEERVQLEAWYVRNWTVWLDCIILAKTFKAVLSPANGSETAEIPASGATEFESVGSRGVPPRLGIKQREGYAKATDRSRAL